MKKTVLTITAAIGLALGLVACDDSTTEAAGGVTPMTAPLEISDTTDFAEEAFEQVMAERGIPADVDLGYAICDALDSGVTGEQVIELGIDNGISAYDSGYVLGASVTAFCPHHADALGSIG